MIVVCNPIIDRFSVDPFKENILNVEVKWRNGARWNGPSICLKQI